MEPHRPRDWFEFWVRFVCGALLGLPVSWYVLAPNDVSWWALVLGCVIFGVLAGWFGDRFWRALGFWSP